MQQNASQTSPTLMKSQIMENLLQQALLMAEIGVDMKERYVSAEKYVIYLKSILAGADKALSALHFVSKSSLMLSKKLINNLQTALKDSNMQTVTNDVEKLLDVVEKQLNDYDYTKETVFGVGEMNLSFVNLGEKIRNLEARQRNSDSSVGPTPSSKSVKADVDEKYPENWSRESLIDLSSVVNLPPVPEDIFTSFSNRPTRSSSLSSLKSIRKVKLFLQKAESSDDEDSSDNEEHDYSKLLSGDTEEPKPFSPSAKKLLLGNIKEESQD